MGKFSDFFSDRQRLLIAVASDGEAKTVLAAIDPGVAPLPGEWQSVHGRNFSLVHTGVGKANAAGAVSRELTLALQSERKFAGVLSLGIAGSLRADVEIGSVVLGSKLVLADEGMPFVGGNDWTSLESSGWAKTNFDCPDCEWFQYLRQTVDHFGAIATVSTISGTDQIACDYVRRSGAIAEAMEGAAIAQVCAHIGVACAEYRVISNRCGNRNVNKLDIPTSFRRLTRAVESWGFESAPEDRK